MAEARIVLLPGVNSVQTPTLNQTAWAEGNLIRFQQGLLQPVGGWQAFNSTPLVGTCRSLHPWQDLDGNQYLACGTNERLQLYWAGNQYDITPIVATNTLTSAFSTTITSATVNVEDTGHGASVDQWIDIEIPLAIGGIVLFGYYKITEIIDADNYTIEAASAATATVSSGGDTPIFDTTMSSATVTVTLPNHGQMAGDTFTVQVSTSVGGLTIDGDYQVETVPDADTFTIDGGSAASSTDTASENGNDEIVDYLLPSGPASNMILTGWGGGSWGDDGWGESMSADVLDPARIWSLDNFGEYLLANPTNYGLYVWQPPVSPGNVATEVATAPTNNIGMFVAMPQAQVIVYGAETTGIQDPLLIRWSDTGDYTDFTPTSTNQAGSYRLSRGSHIVGGFQAAQTALIWTDLDLWSMVYQGAPYIYSIATIGQNCGLIAQNAAAILAGNVFWMSLKGFFAMQANSVSVLPCAVWDEIFADLDTDNQNKIVAGANTPFNEVWFFYPSLSGGSGEIDAYVKVNLEGTNPVWDFGSLIRTAWLDQSILGMPLAVDGDGLVQQHETGTDANGEAMANVYALSGYADIAGGQDFPFIDQIIPDFRFYDANAAIDLSVYGTNYPFEDPATYGPFPVATTTKFITMRARNRQMAFRVEFDGQSFVRLGAVRYRVAPAGRR